MGPLRILAVLVVVLATGSCAAFLEARERRIARAAEARRLPPLAPPPAEERRLEEPADLAASPRPDPLEYVAPGRREPSARVELRVRYPAELPGELVERLEVDGDLALRSSEPRAPARTLRVRTGRARFSIEAAFSRAVTTMKTVTRMAPRTSMVPCGGGGRQFNYSRLCAQTSLAPQTQTEPVLERHAEGSCADSLDVELRDENRYVLTWEVEGGGACRLRCEIVVGADGRAPCPGS